eukprot:6200677-Pleurochrysis_carterae.AAC.1
MAQCLRDQAESEVTDCSADYADMHHRMLRLQKNAEQAHADVDAGRKEMERAEVSLREATSRLDGCRKALDTHDEMSADYDAEVHDRAKIELNIAQRSVRTTERVLAVAKAMSDSATSMAVAAGASLQACQAQLQALKDSVAEARRALVARDADIAKAKKEVEDSRLEREHAFTRAIRAVEFLEKELTQLQKMLCSLEAKHREALANEQVQSVGAPQAQSVGASQAQRVGASQAESS